MKSFSELNLDSAILKALKKLDHITPTKVQVKSIPDILAGRDLLASAQTGTGKTAAFALPIIQALSNNPAGAQKNPIRALVLAPTRELANQIFQSFNQYGAYSNLKAGVVYGGMPYPPQIRSIKRGLDILVATPGRLLDLCNMGHLNFSQIEFLVLDEADRMLDMGFKKDLEKIVSLTPSSRQTVLFSATISSSISKISKQYLKDPVRVDLAPVNLLADNLLEKVMFVKTQSKSDLLFELLKKQDVAQAIIFTKTKRFADRLSKSLHRLKMKAETIHGDKSQNARKRSLAKFRDGGAKFLIATDVAARGIDLSGISHVFNFHVPLDPENYVHRVGRTARAGNGGTAITFCDGEEVKLLKGVENLIKRKITIDSDFLLRDDVLEKSYLSKTFSKGTPSGGQQKKKSSRRKFKGFENRRGRRSRGSKNLLTSSA